MRPAALVRNIILIVLGSVLMFYLQPLLYENRIFLTGDQVVEVWLDEVYNSSALLVYAVSIASTALWYFWGARSDVIAGKEFSRCRVLWGCIGFAPILSIIAVLVFFNTGDNQAAQVSLTGLLILDILVLFWLPTATSSPDAVKYVPFGSFFLRRFVD